MRKQSAASPAAILFADHAESLGGAEHSLLLLMQHLDKTRWQPHLACPPGDLADAAKMLGIPWHKTSLPRLRRSLRVGLDWYSGARELVRIAAQVEAQVLVANTVRAAFFSALAGKMGKRPFLWHMRDFWLSETEPRYRQLDTLLKKMLCRSAWQIVANSHATAQHLPCPQITVIHNGIDLAQFSANADGITFRQKSGIPTDAPLVGTIGRLRPWKGQRSFIEMAAKIVQTQPETHFVIVGGNPFGTQSGYLDELQEMATRNLLNANLHFAGHLREVSTPLAAIDVFVHCGAPEPFGLVNIEAMASGKPVVAFEHGALPEIVVHGQTGLLVPPYNIIALANAVGDLLKSPQQSKLMGQAGRRRVEERFTIEQTAVQFSQVLEKIVSK